VLAAEQLRLGKELRELSGDQNSLVALLQHPDPKVRTLALGAIFEREDGRDLPSIATLINDSAPTFPNLLESLNQQAGPRALAELERINRFCDTSGFRAGREDCLHGRPTARGVAFAGNLKVFKQSMKPKLFLCLTVIFICATVLVRADVAGGFSTNLAVHSLRERGF
jgi:hypothetical protein